MTCTCVKINYDFKPYCYADLPYSAQVNIFKYLSVDDLFRIGRTCRKWYFLSRDSRFWTRVDIGDLNLTTMNYDRIRDFLPILPPTITHLKLRFIPCSEDKLTLPQLFLPIKERCPVLKVLVFHVCFLSYVGHTNTDFCIFDHIPLSVRVFACQKGELEPRNFITNKMSRQIYPLVVLDLSASVFPHDQLFFDVLARMVNLKELRLAYCGMVDDDVVRINTYILANLRVLDLEGSVISHVAFNYIRHGGMRLEELYLCDSRLSNDDIRLDFGNNFQCLQLLCLRRTAVSDIAVARLLRRYISLRRLYISYRSQLPSSIPFPRSSGNKVLCLTRQSSCKHYSKRNYMLEDY